MLVLQAGQVQRAMFWLRCTKTMGILAAPTATALAGTAKGAGAVARGAKAQDAPSATQMGTVPNAALGTG